MRARIVMTIVLLLVVAVVFAFGAFWQRIQTVTIPTGTPSGELAFVSDRSGDWDIFVIDPSGALRNLTGDDSGAHDYFASWDFASERVNFLTSRTGDMGPGQVLPDGSELRTLSIMQAVMVLFGEGRLNWDAQWYGEQVLWASLRDLNLELYVSDGSDEKRLTNDGGRDWFPAWSPDGSRIVFSSDRNGNEDIYLMDADGSNLRQISDFPQDDTRPLWSLDGQKLLFVSEAEHDFITGVLDYYLIDDLNTPMPRKLGEDEIFEGGAVWSPDGSQIAFMSNQEGNWDIYVMDATRSNIRRVTDDPAADVFPVWRPAAGSE